MLISRFLALVDTLRADTPPGSRVHPSDLVEKAFKEYYNLISPLRKLENLMEKIDNVSILNDDNNLTIKEANEIRKAVVEMITNARALIADEQKQYEIDHSALWNRIMTYGIEGIFDPKEFDDDSCP